MRVIAGKARRLNLETLPGLDTRPTTDRIKETLFNILQADIPGASFLDLFAGSGAIGIEALSRGASHAVFVDRDNACCNVIRENLAFTHLDAHSEVLRKDALSAVAFLEGRKEAFDIIFMDPPYASDGVGTVLERLDGSSLVAPHTILIFEEDIRFPLDFIDGLSFEVMKEKKYKTNKHVWLKKV